MKVRTLKNANTYFAMLHLYALHKNVTIMFTDEVDGGVWYPDKRIVAVEEDLEESEQIAILLHELGHETDSALDTMAVKRAYWAFVKNNAYPRQRRRVMFSEIRAWMVGRAIAKYLKIPLGKWYTSVERNSLSQYERACQREYKSR